MRKILNILLLVILLLGLGVPLSPVHAEDLPYPIPDVKLQYYQTFFPAGLRYSPGWYGTFGYAPPAADILLYDDDASAEWGTCIFGMPAGVMPAKEQGGTSIQPLTIEQVNAIIRSYLPEASVKPFDAEILDVMRDDHFFSGAWAGDKLKQKWSNNPSPPKENLSLRQLEYIEATANKPIKQVDLARFDPPRYWVGDSGNLTVGAHWSDAPGGAGGASVPTSADATYFDLNSFTIPGQEVIVVTNSTYCLSMNWTGVTNNPTINFNGYFIRAHGDITWASPAEMTITGAGQLRIQGPSTGIAYTSNGQTLTTNLVLSTSFDNTLTLQDDFVSSGIIGYEGGGFNTNGKTVTILSTPISTDTAKTLTLGSSIVNILSNTYGWGYVGSNLTVVPNTASIRLVDVAPFSGGNITTYNEVQFNGTAHTISGNNTFASIKLGPAAMQTLTFTDGDTQTTTNISRTGTGVITMQGTGTAGWNITKANTTDVEMDNISVSYSTASPVATWYAGAGSTNGGNNTGWSFTPAVSTAAASSISMTKDGVTSGNFSGNVTDMGSASQIQGYFDYGLTAPAYGGTTATQNISGTGVYGSAIPSSLTPGATYHYRPTVTSGPLSAQGADGNFILTLPAITTSAYSNLVTLGTTSVQFNGNVSSVGVASSYYAYFEWGPTPAYGNSTSLQTKTTIGDVTATVTGFAWNQTLHYRAVVRVGSVNVYGSNQTVAIPPLTDAFSGMTAVTLVTPVLVLIAFLMAGGYLSIIGVKRIRDTDPDKLESVMLVGLGMVFVGVGLVGLKIVTDAVTRILTGG